MRDSVSKTSLSDVSYYILVLVKTFSHHSALCLSFACDILVEVQMSVFFMQGTVLILRIKVTFNNQNIRTQMTICLNFVI